MTFDNNLLTAENLEQLQMQSDETQKFLASQMSGITDISSMLPTLLTSNYELGGNISMLPSPETDSLISSPSLSNPDEELDIFALQPSVQEQKQLLSGIPIGNPVVGLNQNAYEKALMNLIANNQLQTPVTVCDPLMNINDESLALNLPGMLPLKNQSPIMNPLDLTNPGLSDISVEALDQLLNPTTSIEVPSLIPSTVEPTLSPEMIDPLLLGANNPYLVNELLRANKMNSVDTSYIGQISTPPQSPIGLETLGNVNELAYLPVQSPIELPEMDFINATAISTPTVQPVVLSNVTPTVPSQKVLPVIPAPIPSPIPAPIFTPELEQKKIQPVLTKKRSLTKTNYTYVPATKKRSNSDLKSTKLERSSSTKAKASQKKSVPMVKEKNGKIQKQQQIKHTFVIETPGISYGKKTSGRKRKCKKNDEDDIINNLPQVPQVPCRPNVAAIPPQKLSKIHARTSEDLDSLIYKCEYCPSAFSRKHDLKRHIKIHTGATTTTAQKCKH